MFESLKLGADEFLDLHAQAKSFMLDPAHPERLATVGIRGKSDSRGIKLELSRCTAQFLEGGVGLQFFGHEAVRQATEHDHDEVDANGDNEAQDGSLVEGTTTQRRHRRNRQQEKQQATPVWPEDRDQLIALCMPLLRRIITNEKQRQYAASSRKADKVARTDDGDGDNHAAGSNGEGRGDHATTTTLQLFAVDAADMAAVHGQNRTLVAGGADAWSMDWLRSSVERSWGEAQDYRVQTPSGLWVVETDDEVRAAVTDVLRAPWLERVVRVVVTLRLPTEMDG